MCALERGDEVSGLAALRAARDQVGGGAGPILEALLDDRREDELLTTTVPPEGLSPEQLRCLAGSYLGARRVLRGEQLLRAWVASGVTEYPQHGSACAWLERLASR